MLIHSSKFFEMMLSENMKESNKAEIEITDFSPEEFYYFMLFLYSEGLTIDLEKSLELLKVIFYFILIGR
jgi:hypothetical protein